MSADSGIGWTDHTFNPWWGCVKVSEGCANCYAETFSRRVGLKVWGQDSERRFFGEKHWQEPLKWDRVASKNSARDLVFVASMADVLEKRDDLVEPRARLFSLAASTPSLVYLVLTKRPENAVDMLPPSWGHRLPANVWIGATVENRKRFDERKPHLCAVDGRRFLSAEPLLEDLGEVDLSGIDWVIIGGESGPGRRPFDVQWIANLVRQCDEQGVRVFVKQDSALQPGTQGRITDYLWARKWRPTDPGF